VPDDDLVFDDFRDVKLKSVELHRLPFFSDLTKISPGVRMNKALKGEIANF
jgi:hypothetical protein